MTEQPATPYPGAWLAGDHEPTVRLDGVSRWYGDLVAVSDLTFAIGPGVTALLGPNGSGKTTTLRMISGLIAPSTGTVQIMGGPSRGKPAVYRNLGLVPDVEQVYPSLTGREFVRMNAILQGVDNTRTATERAINLVEMGDAANRPIGGYSKGMRQRIKVAAALVHDPAVLLLDEPLNGTDPAQRAQLIALMRQLGDAGKTLLVSSHVLVEVERFAHNIIVIVNGKLAAAGDYRTIRDRIDGHPHTVRIRCDAPRLLAAALIGHPATASVKVDREGRIIAETSDIRTFSRELPRLAQLARVRIFEVSPVDESLQAVFSYIVGRPA